MPFCTAGRAPTRSSQALTFGKLFSGGMRVIVDDDPGVCRDVGDRVRTREVVDLSEAPVEHAEQAVPLVRVALDRVRDLLLREHGEVPELPEHGADAAHLEHQPRERLVALRAARREELPRLFGQVDEDGA
jgi:hypothetical protein